MDRPGFYRPLALFYAIVICAGLQAPTSALSYDLIIRQARIVDGTGNAAYYADLAVTNGRIAAVGKVSGSAKQTIDAPGLVLTPGFIDVHTHAEDILELPLAENFVRMGVTTLVLGNCGTSMRDVAGLFQALETTNVSVNVATLVGHGTVRGKVMGGSFMRPPSAAELEEMKALVEQGMKDGALGMSTGLIYLPGTFAKTEELVELAKVAAAYDGIYASHMRDEGPEIFEALAEVFTIAREAHIRAQVSHVKLSAKANWGHPHEVLKAIDQARSEGLDITQDQYLYAASSTGISQLVPEYARESGKFSDYVDDPRKRAELVAEMKDRLAKKGWADFSYATIAHYKHDRSLDGLDVVAATRQRYGSDALDRQIELILEIHSKGGATGVFHGISEKDLQAFLRHPNTMIAADSGVRRFGEGVPHPRGYGNNARLLAEYVREQKVLRLEDAVRRMTSLPATTFHLRERGLILQGNCADLVLFDPALVQDHASFDQPHQYATGFSYVIVNGVVVVKDDKHTGAKPGRPIRHKQETR